MYNQIQKRRNLNWVYAIRWLTVKQNNWTVANKTVLLVLVFIWRVVWGLVRSSIGQMDENTYASYKEMAFIAPVADLNYRVNNKRRRRGAETGVSVRRRCPTPLPP